MSGFDQDITALRQSKNGSTGGMGKEEMTDQVALNGEGAYDRDIYDGGGDKFAG